MPAGLANEETLKRVLRDHCAFFVLVNLREIAQGGRFEQAYQIRLRDPTYREHLVSALRVIDDVQDISLVLQDPALEV